MNPSDNRRVEPRISVRENVYVVLDTQPQIMGQMVEISSKGLAFIFVDLESASERLHAQDTLKVDLFTAGRGYFIRNLPCRIVSKIDKTTATGKSNMMIKRVGIVFESLSLSQQVQINAFVRHHGPKAETRSYACPGAPIFSM